jgi:hypothetical protein
MIFFIALPPFGNASRRVETKVVARLAPVLGRLVHVMAHVTLHKALIRVGRMGIRFALRHSRTWFRIVFVTAKAGGIGHRFFRRLFLMTLGARNSRSFVSACEQRRFLRGTRNAECQAEQDYQNTTSHETERTLHHLRLLLDQWV